jgi:hypothetical protein
MKTLKQVFAAALVLAPLGLFATSSDPIDLTAAGSTIVGYITDAAGFAVVVFVALYGLRAMVRAFRSVK